MTKGQKAILEIVGENSPISVFDISGIHTKSPQGWVLRHLNFLWGKGYIKYNGKSIVSITGKGEKYLTGE